MYENNRFACAMYTVRNPHIIYEDMLIDKMLHIKISMCCSL